MGDNVLRDLRRDPPRERTARGEPTRTLRRERPPHQESQGRHRNERQQAPSVARREPRRDARIEQPRRGEQPRREQPRGREQPRSREEPRGREEPRRRAPEPRREEPRSRSREEPRRRSPEPRRDSHGRAAPKREEHDDYFYHADGDRPIAYPPPRDPPPRRGSYYDADTEQLYEDEYLDSWEPAGIFDQLLDLAVDLGLRILEVIAGAGARAAGEEISYYFKSRRVLPRRRSLRRRRLR